MKKAFVSTLFSLCLTAVLMTHAAAPAAAAEDPAGAADTAPMYAAYLADLQNHRNAILQYTWQMSDGESHYPTGSEPNALKPAALADIQGDEHPELIYLYASNPGGTADLRVVGWENGALKELCSFPNWDVNAANGTHYALFRIKGEKNMYAYSYIGDETGYYTWYRFREQDDSLSADLIASADVAWSDYGEYASYQDSYTADRQSADQAAYEAYTNDLAARAETTLLFSGNPGRDSALNTLFRKPLAAMNYEEARTRLYELSGGASPATDSDPQAALFSALNGLHLTFMSGAGAWSSELSMQTDGRFTLDYHDSNMGESGDGYDATVYVCRASGRFDQVQKQNDTTYTMHLAELTLEETPGSSRIEDTGGGRVLLVASGPYGLDEVDTVTVYLPGTPMSSIPEDALFRMFYKETVLNGVVIFGSGDFFTEELPGPLPGSSGSALTADPVSGGNASSGGEVFPDSSSRQLTESDVASLSPEQAQTAINEIYARHGYAFKDPGIRAHFDSFSWYKAETADMDAAAAQFNAVEDANVRLLASRL